VNRRDFVKRATAVIVPAAILGPRFASAVAADELAASPIASPITAVVYDERYTDCRMFTEAFTRAGAVAFATNGDSASLWYGSLRAHLAQHGGRVAGFTTYSDFSVSQSCGRELNLKLLYEGAHDCRASVNLTHRLPGGDEARDLASAFAEGDGRWPEHLAWVLCDTRHLYSRSIADANGFPNNRTTDYSLNRPSRAELLVKMPRSGDHPGYLMSWLLVPGIRPSQSIHS
jgi:hypothetical protein